MRFFITAMDGTDNHALERRLAVRQQHMAGARQMCREKTLLYACAILDDAGKMIGSTLIVDFPSEESIHDDWLVNEPYILGNVWQDITIRPCAVPDFCLELNGL